MKKRKEKQRTKPVESKPFDDRSHLWPCCHFKGSPPTLPEPMDPVELERVVDEFLRDKLDEVYPPVVKRKKEKQMKKDQDLIYLNQNQT